jgi:coenzyme F420-reducing hydrogenase alpha subunit
MTYRGGRALKVPVPNRAESEGVLRVRVEGSTVTAVRLEIYEPPRFFESFLRGRAHTEPPDITARICGVCPVAYQTSACNAIEHACGVTLDPELTALRRLLYCGEWIASHALHIHLMHAPDYLGYPGVVELAKDHPALVERGLTLKKAGNALTELIGGRTVHPVNVRVGGFHRVPQAARLKALADQTLRPALETALETATWVAGFTFPDFSHDHELLALVAPEGYPMEQGVPHTSTGASFPVGDLDSRIAEDPVADSPGRRTHLAGRTHVAGHGRYLTGPSARYALNAERLSPLAREIAEAARLSENFRNPFRSIMIRAVELVHAAEEALRLIDVYQQPSRPAVEVPARAGTGYGVSEAPRGALFHRYTLDPDGMITSARILPPTAQNQASIEDDLRRFLQDRLHLPDDQLARECEQAIRNYDPCVSCTSNLVALTVVRS